MKNLFKFVLVFGCFFVPNLLIAEGNIDLLQLENNQSKYNASQEIQDRIEELIVEAFPILKSNDLDDIPALFSAENEKELWNRSRENYLRFFQEFFKDKQSSFVQAVIASCTLESFSTADCDDAISKLYGYVQMSIYMEQRNERSKTNIDFLTSEPFLKDVWYYEYGPLTTDRSGNVIRRPIFINHPLWEEANFKNKEETGTLNVEIKKIIKQILISLLTKGAVKPFEE